MAKVTGENTLMATGDSDNAKTLTCLPRPTALPESNFNLST